MTMLCKQCLTKKEMFVNYTPVVEVLCSLIKNFCYDQLVLAPHILQIMQEEDTLTSLSMCYHFAAEYKNSDIATSLLLIFNKYTEEIFEVTEALQIFQYSLKELANICIFQN